MLGFAAHEVCAKTTEHYYYDKRKIYINQWACLYTGETLSAKPGGEQDLALGFSLLHPALEVKDYGKDQMT